MTLIDLGELRGDPRPEPPVRRRRPGHRAWSVPAVLVLALLTLAASLPRPGRDLAVVPAHLGSERVVLGKLLLVVEPRTPQQPRRSMTAYRLPGAAPVWRAPLPVASDEFWAGITRGETLLITGYSAGGESSTTAALDAATGAELWRQPGSAVELADGSVLLEELSADGARTLRAVDPCCGTRRWAARLPPGEIGYRFAGQGMDRLVTSDPEGRVEVRDTGTGTVLAAGELMAADGDHWFTQVVGDLLLVFTGTPPGVTAYGLDRLDRRWQAPLPGAVYAIDCDGVLCVQSRSGALRALDPASGRSLWTAEGRNDLWQAGGKLIVARTPVTGIGRPDLAVLDPRTGEVRAELGRWELVRSHPGDPLIGVRRHPDRGLFVAELDTSAGVVRPLDVLPGAAGDCEVVVDHLLCRRHDASLGLWPLRR